MVCKTFVNMSNFKGLFVILRFPRRLWMWMTDKKFIIPKKLSEHNDLLTRWFLFSYVSITIIHPKRQGRIFGCVYAGYDGCHHLWCDAGSTAMNCQLNRSANLEKVPPSPCLMDCMQWRLAFNRPFMIGDDRDSTSAAGFKWNLPSTGKISRWAGEWGWRWGEGLVWE